MNKVYIYYKLSGDRKRGIIEAVSGQPIRKDQMGEWSCLEVDHGTGMSFLDGTERPNRWYVSVDPDDETTARLVKAPRHSSYRPDNVIVEARKDIRGDVKITVDHQAQTIKAEAMGDSFYSLMLTGRMVVVLVKPDQPHICFKTYWFDYDTLRDDGEQQLDLEWTSDRYYDVLVRGYPCKYQLEVR